MAYYDIVHAKGEFEKDNIGLAIAYGLSGFSGSYLSIIWPSLKFAPIKHPLIATAILIGASIYWLIIPTGFRNGCNNAYGARCQIIYQWKNGRLSGRPWRWK